MSGTPDTRLQELHVALWGRSISGLDRLAERLTGEGADVRVHERAVTDPRELDLGAADVIVVDLGGGMEGRLETCRMIREEHPLAYLVALPFVSSEVEAVLVLEAGADDVIVDLDREEETLARIRAGARRVRIDERKRWRSAAAGRPRLEFADLRIDPEAREVWMGDAAISLTGREFDLLYFLAHHRGRTFSRSDLLDHVWEESYDGFQRTVDTHVRRLRRKLNDDPDQPRYVETVWGVGYKFIAKKKSVGP